MHYDLAILGAGAAGLLAAATAAELTAHLPTPPRIALFEKNPQPGIKVLVCGGGRCNFTNAGSLEFLIAQFGRNGRFLTPALTHLDNNALRKWFHDRNVPSHEEHDGKIYPDSNQAKSVVNALLKQIRDHHVQINTGPSGTITNLTQSSVPSPQHFSLTTASNDSHTAKIILMTIGGMSYQRMGTTGDGYTFAKSLGHSLITPRPAIVGLLTKEQWPRDLKGLAVQNIEVIIEQPPNRKSKIENKKSINDLLFTHFGISGPAVLNPSEIVAELLESNPDGITLRIDFAHHHTHEALHSLMRNWQQHHAKKQLKTLLCQNTPDIIINSTSPDQTTIETNTKDSGLSTKDFSIPHRLAEKFLELEQIPREQIAASLTSAQIHHLVERLKNTRLTIHDTRGFKEAMVTAGGIPLREVDPKTLESKLCKNLFLAGEILDLTGPSGGYNLQLAFSTGSLAATTIATRLSS